MRKISQLFFLIKDALHFPGYKTFKIKLIFCKIKLYFYKVILYNDTRGDKMKKDFGDSIDNKVYEFRVLAKLSQQELAKKVGVSKQTIFVMEKGNYLPSMLLAFRLAKIFDVDINDLFKYKEGENNFED